MRNKAKYKETTRIWRALNHDELLEKNRAYRNKNSERLRKQRIEHCERLNSIRNEVRLIYGCMNPDCKHSGPFSPCQLHFHHQNQAGKSRNVACNTGVKSLIAEIEKCIVVCANCHALITHEGLDLSFVETCKVAVN